MSYNPLDFVRTQLANGVNRMFIFGENDAAHDEQNPSPDSNLATDRRPRELSGRLADRPSTRLNPRAAAYQPHQRDQKYRLNGMEDLALLMNDGHHSTVHEGIMTTFSYPHVTSAILFEMTKNETSSLGVQEVRYLPLINVGPQIGRRSGTGTGSGVFLSANDVPASYTGSEWNDDLPQRQAPVTSTLISSDRPLDILPSTKRYIDGIRTSLMLDGSSTTVPQADTNSFADHRASPNGNHSPRTCRRWPAGDIPVELFDMITKTLSHRDIRNMRLVCKEFEAKTSPSLFKEVVVPFTAELYDMIEDDVSARLCNASKRRGDRSTSSRNGKNVGFSSLPGAPDSYLENEDGMYSRKPNDNAPRHGLRVFQGFGPHMNKFGIRFEVSEADLSMAQAKKTNYRLVEAYHGGYQWPPPGYTRFGRLAAIEKIADETPRMTAALATLVNVREIGLSLDSGLGFLGGPDRSHHDTIFEKPAPVFEEAKIKERSSSDGMDGFWTCLRQSHSSFGSGTQLGQERLVTCVLTPECKGAGQLPTVFSTEYDDTSMWPTVRADAVFSGVSMDAPIKGILYTTSAETHTTPGRQGRNLPAVSPASLTDQQNQWIMEMGWAQSAFLDTYILALSDNPQIFHQVTKISISKISSGLLSKLDRDAFWSALPNVKDVTLLVSPDWRTVCKDEAGCAVTLQSAPSLAVDTFFAVVHRMALLDDIKKLRIGYADGGENAKGIFGRNTNLMPAPITLLDQVMSPNPDVSCLDHIEDVTLTNCWISPHALLNLTATQSFAAITGKTLTLDSVSLSANTRPENDFTTNDFPMGTGRFLRLREGCWPSIVYELDQRTQPFRGDTELVNPFMDTAPSGQGKEPAPAPYKKITFNSCGYVFLPNLVPGFDQSALGYAGMAMPQLDPDHHSLAFAGDWFRRRAEQLRPHMQSSKDDFLGRIMTWMNPDEIAVLRSWQMRVGPAPGEGEDAEYDALPKRGTARFWGHVQTESTSEVLGSA